MGNAAASNVDPERRIARSALRVRPLRQLLTAALLVLVWLPAPAVSWAQSYLYNRGSFPTGGSPAGVVVGDFNSDGTLDLAVTNAGDDTVSVLLGNSQGGFASQVTYSVGALPGSLFAADLNGDGKLDLAVVNQQANTVSILLGNGDGTFSSQVAYATGNDPEAIVAADFNNDHKTDLATVNLYDNTVSILLGNGDGTFQGQTTAAVGTTPTSLSSGDFNGDGNVDLITSNVGTATVTVLLGKGDGTFTRVDSPSGIYPFVNTSELAVGDFNGDGKLDTVVSSQTNEELFVLLGNGDGSFQSPVGMPGPQSQNVLLAGDLNHDGKLDLIEAGTSIVAIAGNGDGTFQPMVQSALGVEAFSLAVADFNGDGQLDAAIADGSVNSVDILLGKGDETFAAAATVALTDSVYGAGPGVVADFNGDGKQDLAVEVLNFPAAELSVELGNGDGTFQSPIASTLSTSITNSDPILVGDFNGDGKPDVLIQDDFGAGFSVALGNGDGTFQAPVQTSLSYTLLYLAVGDFNGDGKADVAVTTNGSATPTLNIFLSNGDGTFTAGAQYSANSYASVVSVDVNQDGRQDLVSTSFGEPLEVFLGNGDGTFASPISGPSDTFGAPPVAADFNGDGHVDLAVGTYSGLAFLAGNGDGTFQPQVYSDADFDVGGRLVSGDFNGDGKLDVATFATAPVYGGLGVILGNGDGTFQAVRAYGVPGPFPTLVAADFNADGVTDLASPNSTAGPAASLYLSQPAVGLLPTSLTFGSQPIGTSAVETVSLTDIGNAPLAVSSVEASSEYSETNTCGATVAIGATCSIDVTFTPTATGVQSGTLTITNGAATSPQVLSLTGTGTGPEASLSPTTLTFSTQDVSTSSSAQSVTLSNSGTAALTVTSTSIGGANSGDYSETNTCGASVAAGASCTISVTFTPTAAGTRSATLTVTDNNNGIANSTQTVTLTGTGAAPIVSLSPASLSFGYHLLGTSFGTQTVTLTNTGNASLSITSVTASTGFTETNTCGTQVAAGASCSIQVTFTPTAAGTTSGSLTISDNAAASPQSVSLSGIGSSTAVVVSPQFPAPLDFGSQALGSSTTLPVLLTNASDQTITFRRLIVAPRSIFTSTNNCGSSLAPGLSCMIQITFTPATTGRRGGIVIIIDNARPRPVQLVRLTGEATAATASGLRLSDAVPRPLAPSPSAGGPRASGNSTQPAPTTQPGAAVQPPGGSCVDDSKASEGDADLDTWVRKLAQACGGPDQK